MFHVEHSRTILVHTLQTRYFPEIMLGVIKKCGLSVVEPAYLFFEYWSMLSIFATYIIC